MYGTLVAVLFNYYHANYADVVLVVMVVHACCGILGHCKTQYENSRSIFSITLFRNMSVSLLLFLAISSVGVGFFWFRILKQIEWVDNHRAEIELSIRNGNTSLSNVAIEKMDDSKKFPIVSFYTENILAFYNTNDYIVVIPLTRPDYFPSFLSGSKFNAVIWNKENGWQKDKVYWGHSFLM